MPFDRLPSDDWSASVNTAVGALQDAVTALQNAQSGLTDRISALETAVGIPYGGATSLAARVGALESAGGGADDDSALSSRLDAIEAALPTKADTFQGSPVWINQVDQTKFALVLQGTRFGRVGVQ